MPASPARCILHKLQPFNRFVGARICDRGSGFATQRHNPDPAFRPLFGTDMITLTLRGIEHGDMVDFEGTALQLPGIAFKAILTRIGD
jgi:hypothetical protein